MEPKKKKVNGNSNVNSKAEPIDAPSPVKVESGESDKKGNIIRVKLDSSSAKPAFEVLDTIDETVRFTFKSEGFSVSCATQAKKKSNKSSAKAAAKNNKLPTQADYNFIKEYMSRYTYRVNHSDGEPREEYSVDAEIKPLLNHLKSLKKNNLNFKINVSADGEPGNMIIMLPGIEKYVPLKCVDDRPKYVNQYLKHFKGVPPTIIISSAAFLAGVTNAKRSSNEIEFRRNERTSRACLCCWKDGDDTPVETHQLDNADSDSSYERGNEDDEILTRSFNIVNNPWAAKLAKLNDNGVIQIYMSPEPKTPLILKTHIGSQGTAIFSVPNNKKI